MAEQSEFKMSSEDFPALPGTHNSEVTTSDSLSENNLDGTAKTMSSIVGGGNDSCNDSGNDSGVGVNELDAVGSVGSGVGSVSVDDSVGGGGNGGVEHQNDNSTKSGGGGVQISPDGKITNIPASMVNNQYGMVGLLTFIRVAESDPNLVTLALGTDLTVLGLNLNSKESLHPTFAGPFADKPCRAHDVEYTVPQEYMINYAIRDKLSVPDMKKLQDDLHPKFPGPFI